MNKILTTERMILREMEIKDAPFLFEILNSKGWLENIGDRNVKTLEEAQKYIQKHYIDEYAKQGFGFYLMVRKEDSASIGMCGLIKREEMEDVDIGFSLLPDFYKKGYGFEAASATMKYAKEVLKFDRVVGITTSENIDSQRLLEKIGLRYEKMIPFKGEELMLFS